MTATDPDPGQILTFCKRSGPNWATVSGTGTSPGPVAGTLSLSPGANDTGTFLVVIRVIDGGDCLVPRKYAEESVSIVVYEANSPPVLADISGQTLNEGDSRQLELSATDEDNNQMMTFCKVSGPEWVAVSGTGPTPGSASGTLTMNPGPNDSGSYTVVVRVFNDGTCSTPIGHADSSFQITVGEVNFPPLLMAIAPQTVEEEKIEEIVLTATDPDNNQNLTFCKFSGPNWVAVSGGGIPGSGAVAGLMSLGPKVGDAGSHLVVVRVIDGGTCQSPRAYSEATVTVIVSEKEYAPVLGQIGGQQIGENEIKTIQLSASDLNDSQTLTFCMMSGPSWAVLTNDSSKSVNPSGALTLSPGANDAGSYTVLVRVIDGGTCENPHNYDEELVGVTVEETNVKPVLQLLGQVTIGEGLTSKLTLMASDVDNNQVLTFCMVSGPVWATVSGSGPSSAQVVGALTLNPEVGVSGIHTVIVRVIDGGTCQQPAEYDEKIIKVTVSHINNTAPVLSEIGTIYVGAGNVQDFFFSVSDENEGQPLEFCKMSGPDWAVLSGSGVSPGPVNGTLVLNPGISDIGNHTLVVRVIDGGTCENPLSFDEEQVTISVTNTAPEMGYVASQIVEESGILDVTLTAMDMESGQNLSFCLASGPAWVSVNGGGMSPGPVSGLMTLSPGANDAGNHLAVVRVIDGGTCENPLGYDERTVAITVTKTNAVPVLAEIGAQSVGGGTSLEVTLFATDGDLEQTLVFCKKSGPEWITVSGSGSTSETVTGTLALNPGLDDEGTHSVTVWVIDGGTCEDPQAFDEEIVTVSVYHVNRSPVLSQIGPQSLVKSGNLVVLLTANDEDENQVLSFCKVSGPDWASITGGGFSAGPVSGTLTLNPGANETGNYEVVVRVIDGGTCAAPLSHDQETVTVTVLGANSSPVLEEIGNKTIAAGETLSVNLVGSDSDPGQTLTFCMVSGPTWAAISGDGPSPGPINGTLSLTPGIDDKGKYNLTMRLIDGGTCENPTAYHERSIEVFVVTPGFELSEIGPVNLIKGSNENISLSVTYTETGKLLRFCKTSGPDWVSLSGEGNSPGPVIGTMSLDTLNYQVAPGTYSAVVRAYHGDTCTNASSFDEESVSITVITDQGVTLKWDDGQAETYEGCSEQDSCLMGTEFMTTGTGLLLGAWFMLSDDGNHPTEIQLGEPVDIKVYALGDSGPQGNPLNTVVTTAVACKRGEWCWVDLSLDNIILSNKFMIVLSANSQFPGAVRLKWDDDGEINSCWASLNNGNSWMKCKTLVPPEETYTGSVMVRAYMDYNSH